MRTFRDAAPLRRGRSGRVGNFNALSFSGFPLQLIVAVRRTKVNLFLTVTRL